MKYFVSRTGEKPKKNIPILENGKSLFIGLQDFSVSFGKPTTLEEDVLLLTSAIFAADRATKRGEREDFCREIEIQAPIINISLFNRVLPKIEHVLRLLSNDAWKIVLRPHPGTEEEFTGSFSN